MSDFFYSKKGQRKIDSFVGKELLYDFVSGKLDAERLKAMKEFLAADNSAKADLQKMQDGLNYISQLAGTQISDSLKEKVSTPTNYTQLLLQKLRFEDWPAGLRMGIEATIVALGISVLAVLIPWHKLMDLKFGSPEVVLTEVDKGFVEKPVGEAVTTAKEDLVYPDDGAPTTTLKTVAEVAPPIPVTTTTTTTLRVAENKTKPSAPAPAELAATASIAGSEKRQGELYRGVVAVTNVQAVTPKLVEKVLELGGRKAGQVDLGWNKSGKSSYFHFTMPAGRYDELLLVFKEYGLLKIQKEKHERIMPEGIMRLIITVDEKQ